MLGYEANREEIKKHAYYLKSIRKSKKHFENGNGEYALILIENFLNNSKILRGLINQCRIYETLKELEKDEIEIINRLKLSK